MIGGETLEIIMLLDNPMRADARVEKEAMSLTLRGYKVKILAMQDDSLPLNEEKPFARVCRLLPDAISRPFSDEFNKFSRSFTEKAIVENYRIIHCHDYKTLLLGAAVKKKKNNVRLVYDAHEYLAGWPFYKEITGWLNRLKGRIVWKWFVSQEKKAIKYADRVITVSNSIAEAMQQALDLEALPTVVRNIPDRASLVEEKYFHAKFKLPDNARVLVHTGNLYYALERIDMLVEVVQHFPQLYLVFIGSNSVLKKISSRYHSQQILFHDYMERMALNECLSAADFGVVHTWQPEWKSHWLSLPNRIMEYTVAGIPVIATAQPEFVRLGEEFGHIVTYRGDYKPALKDAIDSALKNYDSLKKNAMVAREMLSWAKESEKLINMYSELNIS
jgi:glycosyltransferase involved in cell wall biosynthesis